MNLSDYIVLHLTAEGMSRRQLARTLGCSHMQVLRWIEGATPSTRLLGPLFNELGLDAVERVEIMQRLADATP